MKIHPILIPAATLVLTFATVHAADHPPIKEGLWAIHTVTTSEPGHKVIDAKSTLCRNHAYDAAVEARVAASKTCPAPAPVAHGNQLTYDSSCKVGASVMHTVATVTILSPNSSHTETRTTYTPPAFGTAQSTMIQDQTWQGACPAGQQPGDMTMADGSVRHLGHP